MPHYIYSTLSAPVRYTLFKKGDPRQAARAVDSVLVEGGANVANKNLITPRGVMTQVTDEQLALLQDCNLFKLHVEKGYIKVDKAKVDIEKAVSDMESRDESAPTTENDFEEGKAPTFPAPEAPKATTRRGRRAK